MTPKSDEEVQDLFEESIKDMPESVAQLYQDESWQFGFHSGYRLAEQSAIAEIVKLEKEIEELKSFLQPKMFRCPCCFLEARIEYPIKTEEG